MSACGGCLIADFVMPLAHRLHLSTGAPKQCEPTTTRAPVRYATAAVEYCASTANCPFSSRVQHLQNFQPDLTNIGPFCIDSPANLSLHHSACDFAHPDGFRHPPLFSPSRPRPRALSTNDRPRLVPSFVSAKCPWTVIWLQIMTSTWPLAPTSSINGICSPATSA